MEEGIRDIAEEFLKGFGEKKSVFKIMTKKGVVLVPLNEIMYLSYWNHKIVLVTCKNKEYEFRGSLKDCESQLNIEYFFRVNSSMIVNLKFAKELEGFGIIMEDNKKIEISRERKNKCRQKFMQCWERNF